jgi:hypothetical protein
MRRALLWLGGLLVALMVTGSLWLHHAKTMRPTESRPTTTARVIHEILKEAGAPPTVAELPALMANAKLPAGPPTHNDPDTRVWDLCGVGRLPIPQALLAVSRGDWAELPKHLGESAQAMGRERLLQALSQGDARARAAELVLRPGFVRQAALAAATAKIRQVSVGTSVPEAVDAPPAAQALLTLARSSGDAVVASWALASCHGDPGCEGQASTLWRQLEPANAVPWMVNAQLEQGNPDLALSAIAQAQRHQVHLGSLAATALAAMPADVPLYVQRQLLLDVMFVEAPHMGMPRYGALTTYCKAPAAGSPEQARCDGFARLLTERSDTQVAAIIGWKLAQWAGWPAAEVRVRQAEARKLSAIDIVLSDSPYSCAAVEQSRAWVREVAAKGELAALQALAAEKASKALIAK